MDIFSEPQFHDDDAARAVLEDILWPDGPVCPHCGTVDRAYRTKRVGVYRCASKGCRKDFSVTKGTIMERSHISLHKWLQAFHLMASSKKGVSAHQLHRTLDIGYEAAWFMAHRIREAMRLDGFAPMGGGGGIVEADETYYGKRENKRPSPARRGRPYIKSGRAADKMPIISLVERGGRVRTFHVAVADKKTVKDIVTENVARETRLHTDESKLYFDAHEWIDSHETIKHSRGEYVRGDIHTNSAEGYFSIFKRGMKGIYQHCREKHLHRYLAEYDFRYNHRIRLGFNDRDRTTEAIRGSSGKRLTYHQPHGAGV